MKKFFLLPCLVAFSFFYTAQADITPITDADDAQSKLPAMQPVVVDSSELPDPKNEEEVREFFKKRFEEATSMPMTNDIDWHKASSVNVIHTPEYYQTQEENKKTLFQKMYEKALHSLNQDTVEPTANTIEKDFDREVEQLAAETATRFFTLQQTEENQVSEPQVATVSLSLPSGRKILAPAVEHIPYFLSYIDIQANGFIKVEDTITIVADGKKFAYGLKRIFPKYAAPKQKIELILENVTVNGTKVPYILEEIGNNLVVRPKYNQKLEHGVYTYKFHYMVNNKLVRSDNDVLLDWNITGYPLNAFITSANAIVTLPQGHSFDGISVIIGRNGKLTADRTRAIPLDSNAVAFSNFTPLFNGESMNVIANMDKNVFLKDFDKTYISFINNWGNILYAGLGLTAILLSFILSLMTLKYNRAKSKYTPSYNGALMRSISIGKYDRLAFVSQLLDIYRKKALNIVADDNNRMFLEKQATTATLNKSEKKAMKSLFTKKNTRLEVNNINTKQLKKTYRIFADQVAKQIKKYRFIHNVGYLIFSTVMLALTEFFIAWNSVNMAQSIIILLSTTMLYAFYVWIIRHRFKYFFVAIPVKILSLLAISGIWLFGSIYIGKIVSLLILAMVIIIFAFTALFDEYNNFINEAKDAVKKYRDYLITNAETINLSRDFLNQQSNIFALDLAEYFPQNSANQKYYKLDTAEKLKQTLIGIL